MAEENAYNMTGLIPKASPFTIDAAVQYFRSSFSFGDHEITAEPVTKKGQRSPSGFRVRLGDWGIVAWLEADDEVLADSRDMYAKTKKLPAPRAVVESCDRRLAIWSDDDSEFSYTDEWIEYLEALRNKFQILIYDDTNGKWWT